MRHKFREVGNLRRKIVWIIFVVIIFYAFWNGRNLILGPSIDLLEPKDGATIILNPVLIKGMAKNASFISLNSRPIFTDKVGVFSEEILLREGYNVLEIEAADRFGKKTKEVVRLYYKGE